VVLLAFSPENILLTDKPAVLDLLVCFKEAEELLMVRSKMDFLQKQRSCVETLWMLSKTR